MNDRRLSEKSEVESDEQDNQGDEDWQEAMNQFGINSISVDEGRHNLRFICPLKKY